MTQTAEYQIDRSTTIAELEAMHPQEGTIVYLDLGGRSGTLRGTTASIATEVTADTQQGIYIAAFDDATGASGGWVRQYGQAVDASPTLKTSWFGTARDDVTDDSTALNAASDMSGLLKCNLEFNGGTHRILSPIVVKSITATVVYDRDYTKFFGTGPDTIINAVGCDAFSFPDRGYYRFEITKMVVKGNDTAGKAAFALEPDDTTYTVAGAHWHHVRILSFKQAFRMKNAQICTFEHMDIDFTAAGEVFVINPDSGSGQQCNANRVHKVRCTGDGTMVNTTLPTVTERATNWRFTHNDIQFSGTQIPFHIVDSDWTLEDNEFENSTAAYLIHLEATGASLAASNANIRRNVLIGGTKAIRSSKAGGAVQTNTACVIEDNITIASDFFDLESGNAFSIGRNTGSVNDTGGRFTKYDGGKARLGQLHLVNRAGANDAVGVVTGAISASSTLGKNLCGSETFATAATKAVAFGARTEPDAAYHVVVTGNVNETFWVTAKATNGFTINSSNASSTADVDWMILRS